MTRKNLFAILTVRTTLSLVAPRLAANAGLLEVALTSIGPATRLAFAPIEGPMYNAPPSQLDVRDARISELTSLADFMQEDVPLDAIRDYVFERLMQLWPAAYVQYCKRYNQLVRLRGRDATPGPRLDYLQWLPLVSTLNEDARFSQMLEEPPSQRQHELRRILLLANEEQVNAE